MQHIPNNHNQSGHKRFAFCHSRLPVEHLFVQAGSFIHGVHNTRAKRNLSLSLALNLNKNNKIFKTEHFVMQSLSRDYKHNIFINKSNFLQSASDYNR